MHDPAKGRSQSSWGMPGSGLRRGAPFAVLRMLIGGSPLPTRGGPNFCGWRSANAGRPEFLRMAVRQRGEARISGDGGPPTRGGPNFCGWRSANAERTEILRIAVRQRGEDRNSADRGPPTRGGPSFCGSRSANAGRTEILRIAVRQRGEARASAEGEPPTGNGIRICGERAANGEPHPHLRTAGRQRGTASARKRGAHRMATRSSWRAHPRRVVDLIAPRRCTNGWLRRRSQPRQRHRRKHGDGGELTVGRAVISVGYPASP